MANKFTPELLEKAKQAKTAEEISDDALDKVSGGVRICGTDNDNDKPIAAAGGACQYYINEETLERYTYNQSCSTCLRRNGGSVLPCPDPERRNS